MAVFAFRARRGDQPTPATPAQPLRISVLVGALGVLTVVAPLLGAGAAWNGAQGGTSLFVPLRLAGTADFIDQHGAPQMVNAYLGEGVDTALSSSATTDAVGVYAHGGLLGGLAFTESPVDAPLAVLANAEPLIAGVSIAVLAALLMGVVRTTAAREPFAPGNAARLAGAGLTLVVAAAAGSVLPYLAARRFLDLPMVTNGTWVADLQPVLWPLPAAVLLFVLAAAVRAGSKLREQTEGLV